MVRFIIWDNFISKVKEERIYIPIWLDLLSVFQTAPNNNSNEFTFQYG